MKKLIFILAAIFGLSLTVSACSTHYNRTEEPETKRPNKPFDSDTDSGIMGKTLIVYYVLPTIHTLSPQNSKNRPKPMIWCGSLALELLDGLR